MNCTFLPYASTWFCCSRGSLLYVQVVLYREEPRKKALHSVLSVENEQQADAGRDRRTCRARRHSLARTRTGKVSVSPLSSHTHSCIYFLAQQTTSGIGYHRIKIFFWLGNQYAECSDGLDTFRFIVQVYSKTMGFSPTLYCCWANVTIIIGEPV